ncbi:MAG TPA: glycosyltransferase family 2 protein [Halanaerobiales bacterium]|nr:glycosyltransferase family 2 protein [Halanaerobiales bacterium]
MEDTVSIVIPVYNSFNALGELYNKLTHTLESNFTDYEIIMVDDNSSDKSFEKLREIHYKDKRIKIIKLAENFGQQNALMCGFHFSKGNYIVTMDDDLQHLPVDIIKLYQEIKKGYDIVYGIPAERQHLFYRRVGSYLTDKIFNLITNKSKNIRVSSFRILKKSLSKKIIKDKRSFVYLSAIVLNLTDNIGNIYIEHEDRKHGNSNYNFLKLFKLFSKLYIYYADNKICKLFRKNNPQFVIEEKIGFDKELKQ